MAKSGRADDAFDRVRLGGRALGGDGEVAGEMAAGGEAPDADLVGVGAELGCMGADVRTARAVEHGRGRAVRREAVLEDKGCDAVGGKPVGFDAPSFSMTRWT